MIFVTVGTHEQPFDRLVMGIDELKKNGLLKEEVVIQTGFSAYEPEFCAWRKLFPYEDVLKNISAARIVITHGGPSSFIIPLQMGKIPVVVPRQKQFGEHVNDHQLEFCRLVAQRQKNIVVVENIEEIGRIISEYDSIVASMPSEMQSNNKKFNQDFAELVDDLLAKKNKDQ